MIVYVGSCQISETRGIITRAAFRLARRSGDGCGSLPPSVRMASVDLGLCSLGVRPFHQFDGRYVGPLTMYTCFDNLAPAALSGCRSSIPNIPR